MLHVPTLRVSTQPAYIASGCVHPQFALPHANVTRPPAKSVNRCRKSLVYKELYLQTVYRREQRGFGPWNCELLLDCDTQSYYDWALRDRVSRRLCMDLLVLAGGMSRRIGRDKALLELNGQPLIEIVIEHLRPLFDRVIISSAGGESFPDIDACEVADIYPGCGSLGGLHAGLKEAAPNPVFAVACDMPFVNPGLVRMLVSRSEGYDIVVPVAGRRQPMDDKPEYLEPLHAVYAQSCLPHIEALLEQGSLWIFDFFRSVKVDYVWEDEIRKADPGMTSFFNINTPEDFEKAYKIIQSQRQGGD